MPEGKLMTAGRHLPTVRGVVLILFFAVGMSEARPAPRMEVRPVIVDSRYIQGEGLNRPPTVQYVSSGCDEFNAGECAAAEFFCGDSLGFRFADVSARDFSQFLTATSRRKE